jgi:tripartite-type tricarboxylate transporter receptor subunit TctC
MEIDMKNRSALIAAIAVALIGFSLFVRPVGAADDWPKGKRITCLVPFAAGGSVDIMARQLLKYWEPILGATMIVSNRDGATGLLGTEIFLKQPMDGSYIYVGTQMYISAGIVLQGAKYSMDDFAVINFQQFDPMTVAVLEDSKYKTIQDLVADAKAHPGEIKVGVMYGGAPHLGAVIMQERFGVKFKEVTYDNGNAYRTALLGKHVDFIVSNANGDRAIKGKARVLAIADDKRSSVWPDAPTFNEILNITDFPRLGSARYVATHREFKEKFPERFEKLVETYKQAFDDPEYVKFRETSGEADVSAYRGPEESDRLNMELHNLLVQYKSRIDASK